MPNFFFETIAMPIFAHSSSIKRQWLVLELSPPVGHLQDSVAGSSDDDGRGENEARDLNRAPESIGRSGGIETPSGLAHGPWGGWFVATAAAAPAGVLNLPHSRLVAGSPPGGPARRRHPQPGKQQQQQRERERPRPAAGNPSNQRRRRQIDRSVRCQPWVCLVKISEKRRMHAWSTKQSLFAKLFHGCV